MERRFPIALAVVVFAFAVQTPSLDAQKPVVVEFGPRAGVPFSKAIGYSATGPLELFGPRYAFERSGYSGGPTVGVVLYDRIGIEFDAIFKRIRYQETSSFNPSSPTSRVTTSRRANSWEFPLLANYRFLRGPTRPFAGGGVVLGQTEPVQFLYKTSPAFLINGGVEWKTQHVSIKPEFRFTHWPTVGQSGYFFRQSQQFEYLMGFTFHPFSGGSR